MRKERFKILLSDRAQLIRHKSMAKNSLPRHNRDRPRIAKINFQLRRHSSLPIRLPPMPLLPNNNRPVIPLPLQEIQSKASSKEARLFPKQLPFPPHLLISQAGAFPVRLQAGVTAVSERPAQAPLLRLQAPGLRPAPGQGLHPGPALAVPLASGPEPEPADPQRLQPLIRGCPLGHLENHPPHYRQSAGRHVSHGREVRHLCRHGPGRGTHRLFACEEYGQ
jgi:hypothetical protein